MIEIKKITLENDFDELIALFNAGLGETTKEHWKWKCFCESGFKKQEVFTAYDTEAHKTMGMMSFFPERYNKNGNTLDVVQMCDLVVAPEYRGKGIMTSLYSFAENYYKCIDVFMGFPNDCSHKRFFKYGFINICEMHIYNTHYHYFTKKLKDGLVAHIGPYSLTKYSYVPDSIEAVDKKSNISSEYWRITKSHALYEYKYNKNPDTKYITFVIAKDSSPEAYFIGSLNKGRLTTAFNIYDWNISNMLASDTDNLKQIFLKMRPIANRIYIWGNYNQKIFSMLNGIGFEKQQGSSSRMIMKIFTPGIKIDSSEWFITRIDTDY